MQTIYPNLFIGGSTDAYVVLFVHDQPGDTNIMGVLDVSRTLPTRKWHRAKHIALSKVGFVDGKAMPIDKLDKALQFIHEHRKAQKPVLIVSDKQKNTAELICAAYLMWRKQMQWEEALKQVEVALNKKVEYSERDKQRVESFLQKELVAVENSGG